ncbi:hypothetical protein ABIB37_001833 [Agrococcus sp. UYP10]|uniref:Uncharacterized protein n=1 Tax=Agrococcus jenensis TaxID=46353 RepID=A0A3N2ANS0_9MICO|nr:hypothetical protein [Agrococcus jenensis]ROR64709.1 hypothetical protein EDD26_0055 [Agrococcus jenensis]
MRERYDRLVADAARYVDSERDEVNEQHVVAGLFRAARDVERVEGHDTRPVMRVVLERFELDYFGASPARPEIYGTSAP